MVCLPANSHVSLAGSSWALFIFSFSLFLQFDMTGQMNLPYLHILAGVSEMGGRAGEGPFTFFAILFSLLASSPLRILPTILVFFIYTGWFYLLSWVSLKAGHLISNEKKVNSWADPKSASIAQIRRFLLPWIVLHWFWMALSSRLLFIFVVLERHASWNLQVPRDE